LKQLLALDIPWQLWRSVYPICGHLSLYFPTCACKSYHYLHSCRPRTRR